jgi:tetraacyldisaccharide 4'-kinase
MGDTGPLGPVFKPVLGPILSRAYGLVIARKNQAFDAGQGVARLGLPVISVGNLSVGGTGKTPMVETIVRLLRENGHHPCIAMRGYKSAGGLSDEAATYRAAFADVPIVAQPDRTAGLRRLLDANEGKGIRTIVLDDGFQHRQIERDLDLVLIDATRSPFEDHLLPTGWLRESPGSLARADAVIVTRADQAPQEARDRLADQIALVHKKPPLAFTQHAWQAIESNRGDAPKPVESLRDRRVLLVCAIGNPQAFVDQARQFGADVADTILLRDHDPYANRTINRITAAASKHDVDAILVTEKDWMKLRAVPSSRWSVPVLWPRLGIAFSTGQSAFETAVLSTARTT